MEKRREIGAWLRRQAYSLENEHEYVRDMANEFKARYNPDD